MILSLFVFQLAFATVPAHHAANSSHEHKTEQHNHSPAPIEDQKKGLAPIVAARFLQVPHACLNHQFPCALQVAEAGTIEINKNKMHVSQGTQLILLEENQMQMIRGAVWLRDSEGLTFKFGEIAFQVTGDILYERSGDRVVLRNLAGTATMTSMKERKNRPSEIPVGFENWYQGLGRTGEAGQGVVRAFDLKDFMTTWLQVTGQTSPHFTDVIAGYKTQQKTAVAQSGQLYQQAFEMRDLASAKAEDAVQQKRARLEKENSRMRQMFRQRFFEGQ